MGKAHILQALTQLSPAERLAVIEEALHQLRQELLMASPSEKALQQAAQALREDYLNDPELTAFTSLDSEAWDETG
ncbi:MAG: hypothetical protein K6U12_06705 [Armatimonadetes bacterium]|jgi:hypothetical protein|nr:hypothetical protein [Armatimonadota bacterium]GIV12951.1 MAG: hypothetical protein KatS3mg021_1233 [Fimbriimonadales bacterium]CUU04902.1 hypothetical protein GBSOP10_103814 [Armatimonadetes bacterium GBS]CUU34717.1 hypothetical protein GXSOP10_11813 [Armatimonadetes bacterium GXS]CUU35212.1 hypothetical protein DCOP10_11474 [Armatimonadetes bacterium DC]